MYVKKNSRVSFRSSRRPGYRRSSNYSNGKNRNKGNVTQQYQKYLKLAKEASSAGDRIQTDYYYQFADHYSRQMVELGISFEDDTNTSLPSVTSENEKNVPTSKTESASEAESNSNEEDENHESDSDSIESVPFLSEPVKKRTSK